MSFGGPIDSMINSHKSNLGLLKNRKRLKLIQDEYKSSYDDNPIHIKEGNIHEIGRFKTKIKRDRIRNNQRFILIIGLTLIITMVILFWVVTTDYSGVIDIIQ